MCDGYSVKLSARTTERQEPVPESRLGKPDPNFHTVTGKDVAADGIDLDGQDSRVNGKPAPGTCARMMTFAACTGSAASTTNFSESSDAASPIRF